MQHAYVSIEQIDRLDFSSCEGCRNSCCDGSRFVFAPLILEDVEEVYRHFPIVFARLEGEWRILMLFSDATGACRYHKVGRCDNYANRPPACRLYPLSPYFEDILVDTSCPAVSSKEGTFLASPGKIGEGFYHKRLEGFEAKRRETAAYIETLQEEFEPLGSVRGVEVFRYGGELDDGFIRQHRASLRLLEELS